MPTPPLRHPARRPPHLAAVNAARNDRQPPELQAHVAQSTRQQLAGPEAVRERRALLLSSSDTQRLVPPGETSAAAQLVRELDRLPFLSLVRIRPWYASTTPNDTTLDDRDTIRRRPTTRRATTPRTTPSPPRRQHTTKRST